MREDGGNKNGLEGDGEASKDFLSLLTDPVFL